MLIDLSIPKVSKSFRRGFTLIEILIATGILAVLLVISLARFGTFGQQVQLNTSAQQIISVLELARNQTVGSEDGTQYGVHFDITNNQYILFKGDNFAASTETREYDLDKVEIYEVNLVPVGSDDVVFERIRGDTTNPGDLRIRLIGDTSKTETILINSLGQVSLIESVVPTGTRIVDTRHIHLDFGWTMQSSNTMRLIFSDPPGPDVTRDIDIPSFTTPGKFKWEGTVDVSGSDQVLRIHTHTLDASNTVLSVHRDRRFNDKALEIQIDGTTIVTYDAAGIATPSVSISSLTIQ